MSTPPNAGGPGAPHPRSVPNSSVDDPQATADRQPRWEAMAKSMLANAVLYLPVDVAIVVENEGRRAVFVAATGPDAAELLEEALDLDPATPLPAVVYLDEAHR